MFEIIKVLNHNAILVKQNNVIYLALEKGIGFSKKVEDHIELSENTKKYLLQNETKRGNSEELLQRIDTKYVELSSEIIQMAEQTLGKLDHNILLPLADHIAFAIERMKRDMQISNPFANEISLLNPEEYEAALKSKELILEKTGYTFDEEELGYITLHLHCARTSQEVDESMQMAIIIRESIDEIEKRFNTTIDVTSLAYSRLLTHMRYLIARIKNNEKLYLDMGEYVRNQFPLAYEVATDIIKDVARTLNTPVEEIEVGYLAIHIQRICDVNKNN